MMSNGGGRDQAYEEPGRTALDDRYFTTPNVARIYDYYLGGKDNYPADREAARGVLGVAPDVPLAALENREFLKRAVRFLVEEAGIDQFIDIGPGLPTQSNVHHLAQASNTRAHIVYVDNDPVVLVHGRAILQHVPGVTIIKGDLREPEQVLSSPKLRALIDVNRPVALCTSLVLHFIADSDDPYGIMARWRAALCPGSYLVLSHVTGDDRDAATMRAITDIYDEATAPLVPRTRAEVSRFFTGFDLVEPGLVFLSQWRPATGYFARGGVCWAYAGVGRMHHGSES